MKRQAASHMQMARLNMLPAWTTDDDDAMMKPIEDYLTFYERQDATQVKHAVQRYLDALQRYRKSGYADEALDEILRARPGFINAIPFASDCLAYDMTPSDRKHVAKAYRKVVDDSLYVDLLKDFAQNIYILVE